jgi:hypothetical protein
VRRSAGQASLEYVAVIAFVAALLAAAGPAAGAGGIPRAVAHGIRVGICIVASDVCSPGEARAAGLGPCPLASRMDGLEGGVTVFSVDLGARGTLTVTHQSDGTVTAALATSRRAGLSGGLGASASAGPLAFDFGASATAGLRVTAGRGWTFPDERRAHAFLHGLPLSLARTPASWMSAEDAADLSGTVGIAAGDEQAAVDLVGASAGGEAALGVRVSAAHEVTRYVRTAVDAPELTFPLFASQGGGRTQWLVEYTRTPAGPREVVFRHAEAGDAGNRVTETIGRLDLRDAANRAVAEPLARGVPTPAEARAVLRRIREAGVTERYTSSVADTSSEVSASVKLGLKLAVSGARIHVRKRLVAAGAWTGGSGERERFDCLGDQG